MAELIPVTMVNHVAVDMAASPDTVWAEIIEHYVTAKKWREQGTVTDIDDPAAVLGGYRLVLETDGAVDERVIHFTERDETARRLSLIADYLSMPGGMRVHATYHAQAIDGGTRYAIDCHTALKVEAPAGDVKAGIAALLDQYTKGADAHLYTYLGTVKDKVEAAN